MNQFLRPFLELTVILPGMFLAYLPVSSYLRQKPLKLTAWLFPLLLGRLYFGRFSVLFLSNFNATRSFSSAAAAPVSLSQDASGSPSGSPAVFFWLSARFLPASTAFPGR